MPHHPEDERYLHLSLIREEPNPPRRKAQGFPQDMPARGGRGQHGPALRGRVDELERETRARPQPAPGVQPHLVFRVPLAPGASPTELSERLQELGIAIVGIEPDGAIIAFRDAPDLTAFRQALDEYTRGPRVNQQTGDPYASTKWDVFELIEAARMRLWGRADRIGRRLAATVGPEGRAFDPAGIHVLDVELWHRGSLELTRQSIAELRSLIADRQTAEERLSDEFIGESLCLARVRVSGEKLDRLLDMDAVAEVDLPPVPLFDAQAARAMTPRNFPTPSRPPADGPSVCILDSGVASNHPLLGNHVGHAESILTREESPADGNGMARWWAAWPSLAT